MASDATPSDATAGPRIRLFVVDDDDGIRTLLEVTVSLDARFTLAGAASSAEDALAAVQAATEGIDVVLLDVSLPDRDGIELAADIRRAAPDTRIALFTGWSDQETFQRAAEAGADAVFGKDGDPRGVLDGIAELCART